MGKKSKKSEKVEEKVSKIECTNSLIAPVKFSFKDKDIIIRPNMVQLLSSTDLELLRTNNSFNKIVDNGYIVIKED